MRIDHVNLVVPPGAVPATATFWIEVFELAPVERHGRSGRPGAWLQGDGFQIHLSERDGAPHPDAHIALVVDHVDEIRRRATERGAWIEDAEPMVGSDRGFLRDPGGNRVEVMGER